MAKSINQVIVMGRLTRDPETRTTPTGRSVTNFGLAVDRQGQDDQADFFDVAAWEKTGELVSRYLSKGRRCLVQGRLRQDSWEDKETGKRRNRIEIIATDVTFLDGPSSGDASGSSAQNGGFQAGQNNQSSNQPIADIDDNKPIDLSEIPF
jgi:single-strand binding protein